jgi:hypothetical protein
VNSSAYADEDLSRAARVIASLAPQLAGIDVSRLCVTLEREFQDVRRVAFELAALSIEMCPLPPLRSIVTSGQLAERDVQLAARVRALKERM